MAEQGDPKPTKLDDEIAAARPAGLASAVLAHVDHAIDEGVAGNLDGVLVDLELIRDLILEAVTR